MNVIILLGTAAIAVPFLISFLAPASVVGVAVSERFLERSKTIPPQPATAPLLINAANLRAWVTGTQTAGYPRAYAWRVMPLDFIYLLILGGFLALGARTLAATVTWPPTLAKWLPLEVWLIFPVLYTVADFLEDCMIIVLMTQPAKISNATVRALTVLRNAKIVSNALAITQILALGVAGCIWR